MKTVTTRFAGFAHDAAELSAYAFTIDTFTLSLKDGRIIHFTPDDADAFRKWLLQHYIRDINEPLSIGKHF